MRKKRRGRSGKNKIRNATNREGPLTGVCLCRHQTPLRRLSLSAAPLLVSNGCLSCPQLQSTYLRSLSPRCGSPIVVYPDPQDLQDQTTPKAMLHAATLTHSHVRHTLTLVLPKEY